jgi:hypothetical protein
MSDEVKKPRATVRDLYIKELPASLVRAFASKCKLLGITQKKKIESMLREWVKMVDAQE